LQLQKTRNLEKKVKEKDTQRYSAPDSDTARTGSICNGTVSVRLSFPAWDHSSKPVAACLLRSIAARPVALSSSGSGVRMRAVPRCQRT